MTEEAKKVKNFLYTKSYVRKRLAEAGFSVRVLPMRYSPRDDRYWSLLVELGGSESNVVLTCMRDGILEKSGSFSIMGPTCMNMRLVTKSTEVLVETLRGVIEGGSDGEA